MTYKVQIPTCTLVRGKGGVGLWRGGGEINVKDTFLGTITIKMICVLKRPVPRMWIIFLSAINVKNEVRSKTAICYVRIIV